MHQHAYRYILKAALADADFDEACSAMGMEGRMMEHFSYFVTGVLAICTGLLAFALVAVLIENGLALYSIMIFAGCYVIGRWIDRRLF